MRRQANSAPNNTANDSRIARHSLRSGVREILLERMIHGRIAPGERINETALAADLGVSQTPIREALLELTGIGFLEHQTGKGFTVAPLTVKEAGEVYEILGNLEAMALRLSAIPGPNRMEQLRQINHRMMAVSVHPEAAFELDVQWHHLLLQDCPNQRLLTLIQSLKDAVFRYEYAYMRDLGKVTTSGRIHERITKVLEIGDLDSAASLLCENWLNGIKALADWLQKRQS